MIEFRWLEPADGQTEFIFNGERQYNLRRRLQYRTSTDLNDACQVYFKPPHNIVWSEWVDVPTVMEE